MNETPVFRFVQVSDSHVQVGEETRNAKLRWVIETINAETLFPLPDFVIALGDLANGGDPDLLRRDFALFKEITDPLRCPLYPVAGNHESNNCEGDAAQMEPYCEASGDDRLNYTFTHAGLRFVMLNNSGAGFAPEEPIHERNAWLRAALDEAPDAPTIVCCHVPPIPMRDEPVLIESMSYKTYTALDPELVSIIDAHAAQIPAVLSGHVHLSGVVERSGVTFVTTSGLMSYPCDFAHCDVFADRIELEIHQLPPELVTPETTLHGPPRRDREFTDSGHATPDEYVMGRADERRHTIPMPRRLG